jgi:hypothetical protein
MIVDHVDEAHAPLVDREDLEAASDPVAHAPHGGHGNALLPKPVARRKSRERRRLVVFPGL